MNIITSKRAVFLVLLGSLVATTVYLSGKHLCRDSSAVRWEIVSGSDESGRDEDSRSDKLPISGILFTTSNEITAISTYSIFHSADSIDWNRVNTRNNGSYYSVRRDENGIPWIAGSDGGTSGLVLRSLDSGKNWQPVAFSLPSSENVNAPAKIFYDICFDESGNAWLASDSGLIQSEITASGLRFMRAFEKSESIQSIDCGKANAWGVKEDNTVYSTEIGRSLAVSDLPYKFLKIRKTGEQIWLLGYVKSEKDGSFKPIALRSADYGKTWEDRSPEAEGMFYDIGVIEGRGWLIGSGGQIWSTKTNGDSWVRYPSPTQHSLISVSLFDAQNAVVGADKLMILKTK